MYRVTLSNSIEGTQVLSKEPDGISKLSARLYRGGEYHGFFYETSVSLIFYCGAGKEYIDSIRDTQGIDANVGILIEESCEGSTYEEFFVGKLDYISWDSDDTYTRINIIEGGPAREIRNRLDTKVDLFTTETLEGTPLTPFEFGPYDLTMHSKAITLKTIYLPSTASGTDIATNGEDVYVYFPLLPDTDELPSSQITSDFIQCNGTSCPVDPLHILDVDATTININYRLKGYVKLTGAGNYNIDNFDIMRAYGPTNASNQSTLYSTDSGGGFQLSINPTDPTQYVINFDVSESLTFSPTIGDKLFLWIFYGTDEYLSFQGDINLEITLDESVSFLNIYAASTSDPTTAKSCCVFEAGARIAQVITDETDPFRSTYYGRTNSQPYSYPQNGCGAFRAITNGFMIRSFPVNEDNENARTIRLSMAEFFKGLNAIDNLGLGIENNKLVIERKEYFYDSDTVLFTLDNVPGIIRAEAPEYYFPKIGVGYAKWETEFTNGLDEFNSLRQYDTGIKAVPGDKDLPMISNFVASGYRIEAARRKQYTESFTEDSEYDEDNYIICLNRSVDLDGIPTDLNVAEKDENFSQVLNVLSPETAYNLSISPARNLLRWSPVINAGLTKYPGRKYRFTSGQGNYKMDSQMYNSSCPGSYNNELLGENQNIVWDDANNTDQTPIWLPEIWKFKWPISHSQYQTIKNNPKGCIRVSSGTTDHVKLFILEIIYKPDDISELELLRAYE